MDELLSTNDKVVEKPLLEKNPNIATVHPLSKLPVPGGGSLKSAANTSQACKRKIVQLEGQIVKRAKLEASVILEPANDSFMSTTSMKFSTKATGNLSSDSSRVKPTKNVASARSFNVQKRKGKTTVSASTKPAPQTKTSEGRPLADPSLFKLPLATVKMVVPPTRCTEGKKRPAWDTKGRLEDMEQAMTKNLQQNISFQQQILSSNERIALLESMNTQLTGTIKEKEQQSSEASGEINMLQKKLLENENELESIRKKWKQQIQDLEFTKSALERQKTCLDRELAAAQEELKGMKMAVSHMSSAQASLESQLSAVKMNLSKSEAVVHGKDEEIAVLKATIDSHLQTISGANAKIRMDESIRRKLHNTILELKGNVRVFCRVRPLIDDETLGTDGEIAHMHFPDDDHKILELEKLDMNQNESLVASRKGSSNKYEFTFDRVFTPSSSQAEIFEEISQLVQSALDGYNICIFAYGQTGSGKTYTMEGPTGSSAEHCGMIPRAVEQVFQSAVDLVEKGWQYEFEVTFLEIYNETIRDLLGNNRDDVKHEIRLASANSNEVYVTDLTAIKVTNEQQTVDLLRKATHNRFVAETKCNERSSRSHSIFRMKIIGRNCLTGETCCGLLNLIDLAGSERLKESGSQGQRLKETQNINKSLANLGNVIMALANKDSHVPYRNSKLTHLLQNCLGGSSKTLMFVNVSPKEDCFQETVNSLRFATKVNECNIGTAQRKVK